jgi:DNA ligase (NAD+)
MNARDREIARIVRWLDTQDELYYAGKTRVSDARFDAAMKRLRALSPNHPRLKKVGGTNLSRLPKEKLPFTIGSLDKLRPADVAGWMRDMSRIQPQRMWLVEPKFDGQSITIRYLDTRFDRAWSRGRDGVTGQNVTGAARYIQGVRASAKCSLVPDKGEMLIRGEAIMHRSIFRDNYENQESELGRVYKTARNLVCGLTNRLDPDRVATDLRRCTFVALQLWRKDSKGQWRRPSSAYREWVYLTMMGFTTALHPARYSDGHRNINRLVRAGHHGLKAVLPIHQDGDAVGALAYLDHIPTEAEIRERLTAMQKAVDVRLDGLVIQPVDNGPWQDRGEHLAARPSFMKAIKLEPHEQESMVTSVGEIEWNVSKRGLLKPRLILADPVDADGVEVNHATCNNARFVRDWGLRPGRPLRVVRSGDVIPRIVAVRDRGRWVKLDVRDDGIRDSKITATLPRKCPSCGTATRWNPNRVDLMCPNEKCPGRNGKAVLSFFRELGVDDVASGTVADLIAAGMDTVPAILRGATPKRLSRLEGYGERKAGIVSAAIAGALREKPLHLVMHASGCFHNETFALGSSRLQDIVKALGPGMVERATPSELRRRLAGIKGLGPSGLELFLDSIADWRRFYASIRGFHTIPAGKATLEDTVACFTGFRDPEMEAFIVKHGGRVSGMSRKVTVLFAGSFGSTKCKKADANGIEIVPMNEAWSWLKKRAGN